MKVKFAVIFTVMTLVIGVFGAMAKEAGTPLQFSSWGIITVPDTIFIESGSQPMVTASSYGNDMEAMVESVYPVAPETYQIVQKNSGYFQYGYMLRYTMSSRELKDAVEGRGIQNSYLQDLKAKPDINALVSEINQKMAAGLPGDCQLIKPLTPKKVNGRLFYEGVINRTMRINQNWFTETIYPIAYVHGSTVEIAIIFGNVTGDNNLISTVTSMLENAQKMPKK